MQDRENPEFVNTKLFKNNVASAAGKKLKRREDIEGTLMAYQGIRPKLMIC